MAASPEYTGLNMNFLDFEQPIAELEAKIEALRKVGNDSALNISDEIARLQERSRDPPPPRRWMHDYLGHLGPVEAIRARLEA